MKIVPIASIIIHESRQRKGVDTSPELIASITSHGLLHPIVVEDNGDDTYTLLAGERRLRACSALIADYTCGTELVPPDYIPVTFLTDLNEFDRKEIELHENILRKDLTWQEKEVAIASLHKLRLSANPKHTIKETAKELENATGLKSKELVARALLVAEHINEPTVKSAKTANEAHQSILRSMEAEISSKIASREGHKTLHTFICGDFTTPDIQAQLINNSFDVILADPPYGIGADNFGSTTTKHAYEDNNVVLAAQILQGGYLLAKSEAYLFMFCDIDWFHHLRKVAHEVGWTPWRTPIIWNKVNHGIEPLPNQGFGRTYELILFAIKGKRVRMSGSPDVISIPRVSIPGHSAAKPPDLYKHLLARSGNPGNTVLDPCCGVGTIFEAATALNWLATGVEIDKEIAKRAEARSRGLEI